MSNNYFKPTTFAFQIKSIFVLNRLKHLIIKRKYVMRFFGDKRYFQPTKTILVEGISVKKKLKKFHR